jgi:hypothetical protein
MQEIYQFSCYTKTEKVSIETTKGRFFVGRKKDNSESWFVHS